MATQIFDSKHAALLPHATHVELQADQIAKEHGGAFRGFFFAMLFNVCFFLVCAAVWEVWRLIR